MTIATAVFTALSAVSFVACGGGEQTPGPPGEPPARLLAEALADPARSGVATVQLDVSLDGSSPLAGAGSVSLHGPFELDPAGAPPRFDFALDAQVAGFGVDGQLVSTGDDAYVVFFGENYRVGAERVSGIERRLRSAAGAGRGSALDLDVAGWFEKPRYAGADDVAGTQTERIEGTLDSAAAARDLGALAQSLGASGFAHALGAGAGSGPVSAWVAFDDKTVRRISAQFPFSVPPAQRAGAHGITGGSVSLDAQISSVGTTETIEQPPGGGFKPIDRLIERLRDLASLGGI